MARPDHDIPSFAKPLAPYLRSHQETLRMRKALTLYLQTHILSTDDNDGSDHNPVDSPAASHLSLVVPSQANVNVKRIPPEVTGPRKDYLKALQEYAAVKREYNGLFDRIASRRAVDSKTVASTTPLNIQEVLSHYLDLLGERRRYEKLQLFDSHLKEWAATFAPPTEQEHLKGQSSLDELVAGKADGPSEGSSQNVQALISKLEKTVVRAKAKLAREQHLLKQLQDLQASTRPASQSPSSNIRALQRTRDELVQWVEDKLSVAGAEDQTTNQLEYEHGVTSSTETSQLAAAEYKSRIEAQYRAYVTARRSLLDALSGLSQPSMSAAVAPTIPVHKPIEVADPNKNTEDWGSVDAFRNVSEHILPASKYQRSLALQRSYLVGMLAKEKSNLKHTMDRLSQESHLLPEYPILARQPKLRHITSTTAAGLRHDPSGGKAADEVMERAQAWAFAAEAAGSIETEYIQQRIEHGAEMADTTFEQLQQIYDILHQEQGGSQNDRDDAAQEPSDIWTAEVQPRKARAKRNENIHTTGPWSALDGRIGLG